MAFTSIPFQLPVYRTGKFELHRRSYDRFLFLPVYSTIRHISLIVLVLLYSIAGIIHFMHPQFYERIMPPYIPAHRLWVIVSGCIEILLGLLLLFKPYRRFAARSIALMLIAFLPVHVYMWQQAETQPHYSITPVMAWLRLALQPLLILWVLWQADLLPRRKVVLSFPPK